MTWTYDIETGVVAHNGLRLGEGYSGRGDGRNNPKLIAAKGLGPVPPGKYQIDEARTSERLGPVVMNLDPLPDTETFGRSLFRIHGDNENHDASHGCIVLSPACRRAIAASPDRILEVIE